MQYIVPSINNGWEVGVKFNPVPWLDGRLAAWEQTASNEARRKLNDPSNDAENIGRTRRRGIDLQFNARPTPTTGVWLGYALQNSTILQAETSLPASQGKEIDHVPRALVTAGIDWRPDPQWRLYAAMNAQGDYFLERTQHGALRRLRLFSAGLLAGQPPRTARDAGAQPDEPLPRVRVVRRCAVAACAGRPRSFHRRHVARLTWSAAVRRAQRRWCARTAARRQLGLVFALAGLTGAVLRRNSTHGRTRRSRPRVLRAPAASTVLLRCACLPAARRVAHRTADDCSARRTRRASWPAESAGRAFAPLVATVGRDTLAVTSSPCGNFAATWIYDYTRCCSAQRTLGAADHRRTRAVHRVGLVRGGHTTATSRASTGSPTGSHAPPGTMHWMSGVYGLVVVLPVLLTGIL
jgi:hypothetical protein